MDKVEKEWWDFAFYLIGKFYDFGMIADNGAMTSLPYANPERLEVVDFGGTIYRDRVMIHGE